MKTNLQVSTKPDADSPAKQTALSIEWDGCTPEVIRAMAQQALVVKLQGSWRKKGIPAQASVKASDFAPGTRHSGMTLEQAVTNLSAEERAALIQKLQALK